MKIRRSDSINQVLAVRHEDDNIGAAPDGRAALLQMGRLATFASMKHRIALFCSGSGSNAEKVMDYFADHPQAEVVLLLANRADAYALVRAGARRVPTYVFGRADLYENGAVRQRLRAAGVTFVVLAGFLWRVPADLIADFPDRMLNIHPALLPAHGGKGCYGLHVHRAVKAAGDRQTGLTIHCVNEAYDQGSVVFQARCPVYPDDTPEDIAARVLALEHAHFAPVIADYLASHPPLP